MRPWTTNPGRVVMHPLTFAPNMCRPPQKPSHALVASTSTQDRSTNRCSPRQHYHPIVPHARRRQTTQRGIHTFLRSHGARVDGAVPAALGEGVRCGTWAGAARSSGFDTQRPACRNQRRGERRATRSTSQSIAIGRTKRVAKGEVGRGAFYSAVGRHKLKIR